MGRIFIGLGGVFGASGVAMAAVAAHALPQRLDPASLEAVRSAVQMQMLHALALVLTGVWTMQAPARARPVAAAAGAGFAAGVMLFCGAIYGHHLLGLALGPLAPSGGILLILAWLVLGGSAALRGPA